MNIKRNFRIFTTCFCTLLLSGCGIFMGTVVAPLYYVKEEVLKPKPLAVVQLEAKKENEK